MDVLHRCCAGSDVHKRTVRACARRIEPDGSTSQPVRSSGTGIAGLLSLAAWSAAGGVTHAAMESTGASWKPVFHILEGRFELMLVNAGHIKKVPGRKTDVKDAAWIAQLLRHGLLQPSVVPPPPIRERRDRTRQRTRLVRERATVVNRVQKGLAGANIKLAGVASDPLGVSGRALIRAMIAGQDNPDEWAEPARQRLRGKIPQLRQALHGQVTEHPRSLLRMLIDRIEYLEGLIEQFDARITEAMAPFAPAETRPRTIPGIGARAAEVIVAEIGTDMSRSPRPGTWRRGRVCARATTGAPGSAAAVGQPRGANGCVRRWCRWRGRLFTSREGSSA